MLALLAITIICCVAIATGEAAYRKHIGGLEYD